MLDMAWHGKTVHIGCAFSIIELLAVLHRSFLRYTDNNPLAEGRDYLVLSKGHGVMAQYACMLERGWIGPEHVTGYFADGSDLKGLSDSRIPGLEVTSGSLGHGFSVGVGMAMGAGQVQRAGAGGQPIARRLDQTPHVGDLDAVVMAGLGARAAVQRLRAEASVVLTGADTVLADGARLTVRAAELGLDEATTALAMSRPPLRVLIDGRLRVPLNAPFFKAGPALVITCVTAENQFPRGPECLVVPGVDGQVDLRSALVALAARGVNDVLVEAGPSLAGAFAQQGLVDEYVIFIAGKFLGSAARPLLDWPLEKLADAPQLKITEMRAVGDDWRVTAIPVPAASV